MLAFTHLFVSLLLIQFLNLDRNESFIALLFGVGIDLDHVLGLKGFVATNGFSGLLDSDLLMNPGGQWKSMLHSPAASFVVGTVSSSFKLAFPLLFWFIHIGMDQLEDSVLGLFSATEMLLMVGSVVCLLAIRWRIFASACSNPSVMEYLRCEGRRLRFWKSTVAGAKGLPVT